MKAPRSSCSRTGTTRRGAAPRIHAELCGYGLATDVARVHPPHRCRPGDGHARRAAVRDLDAGQIDYVNAHGTGTLQNDAVETAALKSVFGARASCLPVSSTKSMHGHLPRCAGALEFMIAVTAMEQGLCPPTMHLDEPDAACDLDYVAGQARTGMKLGAVMSSSFAFGGTEAPCRLHGQAADR